MLSVNACCIGGLDVAALPIRQVDGRRRSVVDSDAHGGR